MFYDYAFGGTLLLLLLLLLLLVVVVVVVVYFCGNSVTLQQRFRTIYWTAANSNSFVLNLFWNSVKSQLYFFISLFLYFFIYFFISLFLYFFISYFFVYSFIHFSLIYYSFSHSFVCFCLIILIYILDYNNLIIYTLNM